MNQKERTAIRDFASDNCSLENRGWKPSGPGWPGHWEREETGFYPTPAIYAVTDQLKEDVRALDAELTRAEAVVGWAQALLTALNIGYVGTDSPIHKKLREVMIEYRKGDL